MTTLLAAVTAARRRELIDECVEQTLASAAEGTVLTSFISFM